MTGVPVPPTIARWHGRLRSHGAHRALVRQLLYQEEKAEWVTGHEEEYVAGMREESRRVWERLQPFQPLGADARVLEVGSGAHGLIFYFGGGQRVGVDPLARQYADLFPWQEQATTVAAVGHALPFSDSSFDLVLCDNVVDHAEDPPGIVSEMARVLAPGGCLYFTVNVHHRLYSVAAFLHRSWNGAGIRFEVGPFADHTVHLTPEQGRRLFHGLPLSVLYDTCDIDVARASARRTSPRHPGDFLKRAFFKNAVLEVIARRTPQVPAAGSRPAR